MWVANSLYEFAVRLGYVAGAVTTNGQLRTCAAIAPSGMDASAHRLLVRLVTVNRRAPTWAAPCAIQPTSRPSYMSNTASAHSTLHHACSAAAQLVSRTVSYSSVTRSRGGWCLTVASAQNRLDHSYGATEG